MSYTIPILTLIKFSYHLWVLLCDFFIFWFPNIKLEDLFKLLKTYFNASLRIFHSFCHLFFKDITVLQALFLIFTSTYLQSLDCHQPIITSSNFMCFSINFWLVYLSFTFLTKKCSSSVTNYSPEIELLTESVKNLFQHVLLVVAITDLSLFEIISYCYTKVFLYIFWTNF